VEILKKTKIKKGKWAFVISFVLVMDNFFNSKMSQ